MSTKEQFAVMKEELNERQWRLFLGTQARQRGYGGITQVILLSGASWKTIKKGMIELASQKRLPKGKARHNGGGRKKLIETDLSLVADLEKIIETNHKIKSVSCIIVLNEKNIDEEKAGKEVV